jgi:hypothetical protein
MKHWLLFPYSPSAHLIDREAVCFAVNFQFFIRIKVV